MFISVYDHAVAHELGGLQLPRNNHVVDAVYDNIHQL
jgi:hypothetical protein